MCACTNHKNCMTTPAVCVDDCCMKCIGRSVVLLVRQACWRLIRRFCLAIMQAVSAVRLHACSGADNINPLWSLPPLRLHRPACVPICSCMLAGGLPAGRLHAHHVCVLQPGALGAAVERCRCAEPIFADFQSVGSPCQGSASRSVIALGLTTILQNTAPVFLCLKLIEMDLWVSTLLLGLL